MEVITTEEVSFGDRIFSWWYRIAAPPEVPESAPLRDRMRVHSGKLTSVIFLMQMIITLINILATFLDAPNASLPLTILLVSVVIGTILNRFGKTTAGGVLVLVIAEVTLIGYFVATPGGLSPFSLTIFSFFLTSELIAASLLSPWITLPVTLSNCLIMIALITFLPKTPEMLRLLREQPYSPYFVPIIIQVMVSLVCFLWASSTYKEMRRANSAEEVNKLTMEIALQQQAVQQEKQRLEESIQQIVSVHMQVANGNLHARVPLDQQNMLWSIAGSLNNLLARLQRWRHDAIQLQQNEQAIQLLLDNVQLARREGKPLQAYTTGTSLDTVILEISKGIAAPEAGHKQPLINYKDTSSPNSRF